MKTKLEIRQTIEGPEVILRGGARSVGILLALAAQDNPIVRKIITTAYQKINLKSK